MTKQEAYQQGVEDAWAERERADERRRVEGIDWTHRVECRPDVRRSAPPHRESFNVTIVSIDQGRRFKTRYSLLAKDREHAELMALSYHRGTPADVYYVA